MDTFLWVVAALAIAGIFFVMNQNGKVEGFNHSLFVKSIEELNQQRNNKEFQQAFLLRPLGAPLPTSDQIKAVETATEILKTNHDDESIRNAYFIFFTQNHWQNVSFDSPYTTVLNLLRETSNQDLKQLALAFGRWYYAQTRQDRILTIYDEQAIQNDILAHSKS
jgi:hypothetical protein